MKRDVPEEVLSLNRMKPSEFTSAADFENLIISFSVSYRNYSTISTLRNFWH
jgi:hypothetical protein